ncbi:MAG: hypothetical protein ACTSP4_17520 [Candidatus Hodarchaeales archaeon]
MTDGILEKLNVSFNLLVSIKVNMSRFHLLSVLLRIIAMVRETPVVTKVSLENTGRNRLLRKKKEK